MDAEMSQYDFRNHIKRVTPNMPGWFEHRRARSAVRRMMRDTHEIMIDEDWDWQEILLWHGEEVLRLWLHECARFRAARGWAVYGDENARTEFYNNINGFRAD